MLYAHRASRLPLGDAHDISRAQRPDPGQALELGPDATVLTG